MNPPAHDWLTVSEAADALNQKFQLTQTPADIYRYALNDHLKLSIYFQSPVVLKPFNLQKIPTSLLQASPEHSLCKTCFYHMNKVMPVSACQETEHESDENFIHIESSVWDTPLSGCERHYLQALLAKNLGCPEPEPERFYQAARILVCDNAGDVFQLYDRVHLKTVIVQYMPSLNTLTTSSPDVQALLDKKIHSPSFSLPKDAFFVIRKQNLDNFMKAFTPPNPLTQRTSTPLTQLFWLSCKKNPLIDDGLLKHPYKLLNTFEAWAEEEGLSNRLNGDTLKNALERGKPKLPKP